MNMNVDDELDTIEVKTTTTQAVAAATTAAPAVAAATPPPPPSVLDDDGAFEMGDQDFRPKTRLPNLRPDKGSASRIFLIRGVKPRAKETHYLVTPSNPKGMTVICPGAGCPECAKGSDHGARTRIVVLAGKYTNANPKDGKFPAGTVKLDYTIGYLGLSRSSYADVLDLPSEGEDVYGIDIKMSHKNAGIGYSFNRLSAPPAYIKLQDEAVVAELAAPFADGKELVGRIGKRVSVIELKVMMTGPEVDANLSDIDSIQ